MKLNIKRVDKVDAFEIKEKNLLSALFEIKSSIDSSLAFRCGCKSGVCGSCAVRVNGVEKLACKTFLQGDELIEPLKNMPIIRDLVFDVSRETILIKDSKSYINKNENEKLISNKDQKLIDKQSNCILCSSCYSSCPVYEINPEFKGPYVLTRALRYINDKKEEEGINIISAIQNKGIWDCTLCGACTMVCPQGIDPKMDIMNLQNISTQNGFSNPYMQNFDMGFNSGDMGFDPNSF